jgi:hypothetical protein
MKQIEKVSKIPLLGIIALAVIIVFSFTALTACGEDPKEAVTRTPVAGDYDIGSLTKTADSATAVTVTAKSPGTVTVWYTGTGSTTYARDHCVTVGVFCHVRLIAPEILPPRNFTQKLRKKSNDEE